MIIRGEGRFQNFPSWFFLHGNWDLIL